MKILYLSVHQILEYDEIRILQGLGHVVFPLGTYFGFQPGEAFRPPMTFGQTERDLLAKFQTDGCSYHYGMPVGEQVLTKSFVDNFDAIIVMYSIDFIEKHWEAIRHKPLIWRTIGVNIEAEERRIASLRARGCKIVRYSPMEMLADEYAGHDAIIRFGKSADDFANWEGDVAQVITFSNLIKARFPVEYAAVSDVLRGFSHKICGGGNEGIENSIGMVSYETQLDLLRTSRVYLYGVGTFITYTLNFMEAWISGIPVVVLSGRAVLPREMFKFAEVTSLITHGQDGFVCYTVLEARSVIRELLENKALAERVGKAGRAKALSLFGDTTIPGQWERLLSSVVS